MLFKCNYNVKDLQITSTFYLELLKWWSELREDNALNNDWHYVIWNNRDFRIDDKPFFYKKYYDIGIWEIGDLHFDLSNTESYEQFSKNDNAFAFPCEVKLLFTDTIQIRKRFTL